MSFCARLQHLLVNIPFVYLYTPFKRMQVEISRQLFMMPNEFRGFHYYATLKGKCWWFRSATIHVRAPWSFVEFIRERILVHRALSRPISRVEVCAISESRSEPPSGHLFFNSSVYHDRFAGVIDVAVIFAGSNERVARYD